MKKNIAIIVFSMMLISCLAQERVNSTPSKFINKGITKTNIKGWNYNDVTGEWIGQANVIPEGGKTPDISMYVNCMSLQFRTINYKDITYYVLCNYHKVDYYDYPTIYEGRHICNAKQYWILTQQDFEEFLLPTNKIFTKNLILYDANFCHGTPTENEIVKWIFYTIEQTEKTDYHSVAYRNNFTIQRYNNVIRFNFEDANSYKYDTSLKDAYFEIPYSSWLEMYNSVPKYTNDNTQQRKSTNIREDNITVNSEFDFSQKFDETLEPEEYVPIDISAEVIDNTPPVRFADKMPEFIGGMEALYAFIRANLIYPENARNNGIQGTVVVEFIVEKNGSLSNVKTLVPLFPECDNEAVRVIKKLPKWKPGENNGKPARVFYNIPVRFTL